MVVICCLAVVVAIAAAAAMSHGPFPSPGRRDSSPPSSLSFPEPEPCELPDLIVVPEEKQWLLSLAAPVAARLRQGDNTPLLLVSPQPPSEQFADLVRLWNPRHCLLLAASPDPPLAGLLEEFRTDSLFTGSDSAEASILVAKRFWGRCGGAVLASTNDPSGMILGSALAAQMVAPLILVGPNDDGRLLVRSLEELGARRILIANTRGCALPWAEAFGGAARSLDSSGLTASIVERLGPKAVRNIILSRAPSGKERTGATAWLAPYLSLLRGSPVVLCDSPGGEMAERAVLSLLKARALQPRSVTILSDYDSIGVVVVKDTSLLGEYEVEVEPCSGQGRNAGEAAMFAVGRIPCRTLSEASILVSRGVVREQFLGKSPPRVLMVANPKTDYGQLPLCETISRATAEEFKNLGVNIVEFYGTPPGDAEIAAAASESDLVIYEGHICDQRLFPDQFAASGAEVDYGGEYTDAWREETDWQPSAQYAGEYPAYHSEPDSLSGSLAVHMDTAASAKGGFWLGVSSGGRRGQAWDIGAEAVDSAYRGTGYQGEVQETLAPESPQYPEENNDPHLNHLPLLILQSCHSLEEPLARRVFQSGGVGVIGTATNVHSASGSAFVKALCDGLLYRSETAGEALRDARNYFLCLAELKARRGHKEVAKVSRTALSFRLWGDPELKVSEFGPRSPRFSPPSARFTAPDELAVSVPGEILSECRTGKYFVRLFPGNGLAGLVKRLKDKPERRLLPMYFFRIPVPEAVQMPQGLSIERPGETSPRGACLADPLHRFLYVLYLPEQFRKNETLLFRFREAAAGSQR
ncbi:MAG: C25 family cysteine peptidase [bacterium]|nr:C25 family cysteine peptidase [bacterium]